MIILCPRQTSDLLILLFIFLGFPTFSHRFRSIRGSISFYYLYYCYQQFFFQLIASAFIFFSALSIFFFLLIFSLCFVHLFLIFFYIFIFSSSYHNFFFIFTLSNSVSCISVSIYIFTHFYSPVLSHSVFHSILQPFFHFHHPDSNRIHSVAALFCASHCRKWDWSDILQKMSMDLSPDGLSRARTRRPKCHTVPVLVPNDEQARARPLKSSAVRGKG